MKKREFYFFDKSYVLWVFDLVFIFLYIVLYLCYLEIGEGGVNLRRGRVSVWNVELKIG